MMTRAAQAARVIFMADSQAKYADSVNNYGAFLSTLRQYVAAQQPLSIQFRFVSVIARLTVLYCEADVAQMSRGAGFFPR